MKMFGYECGRMAEVIRTGASTCELMYPFITSFSSVDRFCVSQWISRDGERIFPTPPRPVEIVYKQ